MKHNFIQTYIQNIKTLMPLHGQKERKFLNDMEDSITAFVEKNSNSDYQLLVDTFGTPQQVVCDYISSQDSEIIIPHLQKTKFIKRSIIFTAFLILFLVCISRQIFLMKLRKEILEQQPVTVEKILEIYDIPASDESKESQKTVTEESAKIPETK